MLRLSIVASMLRIIPMASIPQGPGVFMHAAWPLGFHEQAEKALVKEL
jgi:hypothetical protein